MATWTCADCDTYAHWPTCPECCRRLTTTDRVIPSPMRPRNAPLNWKA